MRALKPELRIVAPKKLGQRLDLLRVELAEEGAPASVLQALDDDEARALVPGAHRQSDVRS